MESASTGAVALAYVRSLLDCLRARGVDPASLYAGRRIAEIDSGDTRTRMPLPEFVAMFERAVEVTGDDGLPLRVGAAIRPRHYGLLGFVAMHCATLGEAIEQLERYELLVGEISRSRLQRHGERAELLWRWPHRGAPPPVLAQSSLAGWIAYARWLTGRDDLRGEAYFQFPRPRDLSAYRELARGSPLHFGGDETKLVFSSTYLSLPIVQADPDMRGVVQAQAHALMRELAGEPEFVREVKTVLARGLPAGRGTLAATAGAMQLGERALQRRLEAQGVSFQQVLDAVRHNQAQTYLRDARVSLADVAFLLGYSEQSAFQRAFRRWSGMTPLQFRTAPVSATRSRAKAPSRRR
jgi:AraC-like DNA-binding protein